MNSDQLFEEPFCVLPVTIILEPLFIVLIILISSLVISQSMQILLEAISNLYLFFPDLAITEFLLLNS